MFVRANILQLDTRTVSGIVRVANVIDKENLVVRCVDYLGLVTLLVFNSMVFMYHSMMHLHVY